VSSKTTGQNHYRAKLTDHEVELVRQLYETGEFGYRKLAKKFEVSRFTIRSYVKFWKRRG